MDVPNATWLVVEHAEPLLGLSQLHQLRGRVSRGTTAGQHLLPPTSPTDDGRERLQVFSRTTDGFALAEEDAAAAAAAASCSARGSTVAGELWAVGQATTDLLDRARRDAFAVVAADAGLRLPEHRRAARPCRSRYGKTSSWPRWAEPRRANPPTVSRASDPNRPGWVCPGSTNLRLVDDIHPVGNLTPMHRNTSLITR
ncbi:MAG: hypothetical protein U0797_28850 [Gemmataceae bacterium]